MKFQKMKKDSKKLEIGNNTNNLMAIMKIVACISVFSGHIIDMIDDKIIFKIYNNNI